MKNLLLFAVLVTLPLLLGGCGEKKKNSYYEGVLGDLSYYGTTTGDAICIDGCETSATGDLVIPETIDGKPVTHIREYAFSKCSNLTNITIPDSVISLGINAFSRCTNLTSITIGNSVTTIGKAAFHKCSSLTSVSLPSSVINIDEIAFKDCTSLTAIEAVKGHPQFTSINGVLFSKDQTVLYIYPEGKKDADYTIPDHVTKIATGAFFQCSNLTGITIPDSVTSIGEWAFDYCTGLTSITIPDSVTTIGDEAFLGCSNLTAVTFLGDAPDQKKDVFGYDTLVYRSPESKGWSDTFGGATVKLIGEAQSEKPIGEAPSEKPIAASPPAKNGKKFPSSTKELMFGSNPVVTDKDKAFWEAAKSGNLEVVQRLLSEGVDVDIYGSTVGVDFGCTALFWAAKHNHKEVAQFLLDKEAYIDAGAGMGGSPLHRAAYEGHTEIVELLISKGANTMAKTGDGKTVLDFANEEIATIIRKSIDKRKLKQNNP